MQFLMERTGEVEISPRKYALTKQPNLNAGLLDALLCSVFPLKLDLVFLRFNPPLIHAGRSINSNNTWEVTRISRLQQIKHNNGFQLIPDIIELHL